MLTSPVPVSGTGWSRNLSRFVTLNSGETSYWFILILIEKRKLIEHTLTPTHAAAQVLKQTGGGAHGVLVTAVSPAIAFAAEGKVRAEIRKSKLEDINQVFTDLKAGTVNGRVVLMM
jgi:hypothetical protein